MKDTTMSALQRVVDERMKRVRADDEGGVALVSAILFMVLLTGVSLVLLGVIVGQVAPAYVAQKSTRTVYAAQAGLQAGLGSIRSAAAAPDAAGVIFGDPNLLVCSFTGKLDGADATVSYAVRIRYFLDDPTGKTDTWQASNDLCPSSGVGKPSQQPYYASVLSEGKAPATPGNAASDGNRKLQAIYKFRVSNVNVPGGRINALDTGDCMHAVSKAAGAFVRYMASSGCTDDDRQLWVYDDSYQIALASTTLEGQTPLCITGSSTGTTVRVTLQNCLTTAARWNQLWSWVGSASWLGQKNPISAGNSNNCLTNLTTGGIKYLAVGTACSGGFSPEPAVGAGAASYATKQIVNYKEFGRCADVTDGDINKSFMISYPCKQDPTGTGVQLNWNHKWYYTEPTDAEAYRATQIFVRVNDSTAASDKKCLRSPTSGNYVTFTTCNASDTRQTWKRYYENGSYAQSYLFVDVADRCLAADGNDKYNSNWSRLVVTSCNGNENQKWNAPATYNDAAFGGFKEVN